MAIIIPYAKQTWADGSGGGTPVSAARLAVLEEGILDVSQAPAVRAFHTVNQTTTTGVTLALALDSERFDQAGGAASTMHGTVNNSRLTAIYAGIYQISGGVEWAANATGHRDLFIRLNGATSIAYGRMPNGGVGDSVLHFVTCVYSLAVNDYVELCANQNSGGNLNINASPNYSPEFSMCRVA